MSLKHYFLHILPLFRQTIDTVAQMNASAVSATANIQEANTTSQIFENNVDNLQNYTQIAEDTAINVEGEMNTTRQV